jgi:hypothetical protein
MAKKSKKAKRHCPPCTVATMYRNEFAVAKRAGRCDVMERSLDKLKAEVAKHEGSMPQQARRLAFRELLSKQAATQHCEGREASRFNGLFGLGFLGL